jgi:hypothetical protein
MHRLALRFISAKGLSAEFADALEEIQRIENFADAFKDIIENDAAAEPAPGM